VAYKILPAKLKGFFKMRTFLLVSTSFTLGMLAGCSGQSVGAHGEATSSRQTTPPLTNAAVDALNTWWQKATYASAPEKPGTVTPAHKTTGVNGRVYMTPKHVQTKQEYEEEVEDIRWQDHRRSVVLGFTVTGQTVTVITTLSRASTYALNPLDPRDAQELCHDLGSFVWSKENRHFGLEEIKVTGAHGELLSSRVGLRGKVQ
jgi:hypothetical protein